MAINLDPYNQDYGRDKWEREMRHREEMAYKKGLNAAGYPSQAPQAVPEPQAKPAYQNRKLLLTRG